MAIQREKSEKQEGGKQLGKLENEVVCEERTISLNES